MSTEELRQKHRDLRIFADQAFAAGLHELGKLIWGCVDHTRLLIALEEDHVGK